MMSESLLFLIKNNPTSITGGVTTKLGLKPAAGWQFTISDLAPLALRRHLSVGLPLQYVLDLIV
jgi:hypothetical protein